MGFEDVLWVDFDHFSSFEHSSFKKSCINSNEGKCLMNGKGSSDIHIFQAAGQGAVVQPCT